jgi:hypothetical protein
MSETQPEPAGQPQPDARAVGKNPEVRHERTDANVLAVVIFGVGLSGILIVVHLVLHWMFGVMYREEKREDPGKPAIAADRPVFPADIDEIPRPVLQRDAEYDLARLRREEDEKLAHPGWVDQKTKTVRIPIAEAMRRLEADAKLAAANGIRYREPPPKVQKGGKQ